MKHFLFLLSMVGLLNASAQTTHELHMTGEEFIPDTVLMLPGDSVYLVFDTTGHSMVQVSMQSWLAEEPDTLIGFSMGFGTPNPGDFHTFVMDSLGTFYFVCEQHPDEKGLLMVGPEFTSISDQHIPGFKVFPQPATDIMRIEDPAVSYSSVRIDDDHGRPVRLIPMKISSNFDVSGFAAGIYFLTLLNDQEIPVARQKIIISR